jgi:hypothetical protein
MNIYTFPSRLLAGVALTLGTGLAVPAIAGPGPQYWRNLGKTDNTTTAAQAARSEKTNPACTDSRLVSVTETKPAWHNGRGPLTTVEVGKKLVCTSCDTPLIVMKSSWPNARGPLVPMAIKGTHDCTKNGCMPAATTASVD